MITPGGGLLYSGGQTFNITGNANYYLSGGFTANVANELDVTVAGATSNLNIQALLFGSSTAARSRGNGLT